MGQLHSFVPTPSVGIIRNLVVDSFDIIEPVSVLNSISSGAKRHPSLFLGTSWPGKPPKPKWSTTKS